MIGVFPRKLFVPSGSLGAKLQFVYTIMIIAPEGVVLMDSSPTCRHSALDPGTAHLLAIVSQSLQNVWMQRALLPCPPCARGLIRHQGDPRREMRNTRR